MADRMITGLPTKAPDGNQYIATEDSSYTGKATLNDAVAATDSISDINSTLDAFAIRFKTGTFSMPAGTPSAPSRATIDITDIRPSASHSAYAVTLQLGSYVLPYIRNDVTAQTRVFNVTNNEVRIVNTAEEWEDYPYWLTVIYRKN